MIGLEAIDPLNSHLINFHLEKPKPRLTPLLSFQVEITIHVNLIIHHYIIDKFSSTCLSPTLSSGC
jgi:hypothetical protein